MLIHLIYLFNFGLYWQSAKNTLIRCTFISNAGAATQNTFDSRQLQVYKTYFERKRQKLLDLNRPNGIQYTNFNDIQKELRLLQGMYTFVFFFMI